MYFGSIIVIENNSLYWKIKLFDMYIKDGMCWFIVDKFFIVLVKLKV